MPTGNTEKKNEETRESKLKHVFGSNTCTFEFFSLLKINAVEEILR
jgi:hypothetical protein